MPQKQIVKFGEGAGFIMSLAAAVFVQLNQQWLGDHPRLVTGLYATSLVLATLFISQMAWLRKLLGDSSASEVVFPAPAPINNTVTSNGNKIEQHFHGVAPLPIAAPNTLPIKAAPEYPKLHLRFRYAMVSGRNEIWRESNSGFGYRSLVVDVSAELPASGTKIRECTLYGAVRFTGIDPQHSGFLNRLCWLGEAANEMDFEIGKSATLFVLCFENDEGRPGPEWKTFQCKLNRVPTHPFFRSEFDPSQDFGRMTIPVDGKPTITVSLIDAYSSYVVETRTVRMKAAGREEWQFEEVLQ